MKADWTWKIALSGYGICLHHVHWNPEVWGVLNCLKTLAIITNGDSPIRFLAFHLDLMKRRRHLAMRDGWLKSEEHLCFVHNLLRYILLKLEYPIASPSCFTQLFRADGVPESVRFTSFLCANNTAFLAEAGNERSHSCSPDNSVRGKYLGSSPRRRICSKKAGYWMFC